jgi:signal transduction histidine kinase/ligand-binding sensor domain-containing protein
MLSIWSARALALNPSLDVSQYAHTVWRISDGFTSTEIAALAQTSDGYLWFGTGTGLTRFDGVRNTPWHPPAGTSLPDNRIRVLLASRGGKLWIGTQQGLASWDGVKLVTYPEFDQVTIGGLVEDREGTVWMSGQNPKTPMLCAIRGGKNECKGTDGSLGEWVSATYEAANGSVWTVGSGGLWRWYPAPALYPSPEPLSGSFEPLSETPSGEILVAARNGIRQLVDDKLEPLPPLALPSQFSPNILFRDRDGALWIGSSTSGLLHVHEGHVDSFDRANGLSGDTIVRVFEDREGDVWVATSEGLDRFRAAAAAKYSAAQGLAGVLTSVVAGDDGGIWVSTTTGLYRWKDGRVSDYRARPQRLQVGMPTSSTSDAIVISGLPEMPAASLLEDSHGRVWLGSMSGLGYLANGRFASVSGVPGGYIDAIAEDGQGTIWIAHRDVGLLSVSSDLKVEQTIAVGKTRTTERVSTLASDPVNGGIWLGYFAGGVVHLVDGVARESYDTAGGLGKGLISEVRVAAGGAVFVATEGGLSRIKGGHIATLNASAGLPCDGVISSLEDDAGSTWIYTGCGLVRVADSDMNAWASSVDEGKAPPRLSVTVLDNSEGVRNVALPLGSYTPHAARARDGKLWFVTQDGVMAVDPRALPVNALRPLVHVEQIIADRKAYAPSEHLSLPPRVRDLSIDYTALSLVTPEKVFFRYKLEGRDPDWEDAGNRRQAFYTDLAPGNYVFRVIAANNSGVWNEEGASLAFSIAPAYWQTNWFLALCATALVALFFSAYQLRMRQLAHRREMELELAHASRLATMGQLTASIAHEVNQPLGATITNAQAALRWLQAKEPELGEVKQALEQIVRAGNRAADVVARVRKIAKKAPAQGVDVSLNHEIEEILSITNGEAVKHGVFMRADLAHGLPAIKADPVELQQVLLNLVVNAVEAMSTLADGPRELTIRSEAVEEGSVVVSVSDTGPGLSAAALEKIFQAFYTTKESGLGMGLSICRSIIESYGGKLWASANSPRGAVFQFTLPKNRPY